MRVRTAIGLALLVFTVGLACVFLFLMDSPMHAIQELGIATVIAWAFPEDRK